MPIQITYRNMEPSPSVTARIRAEAAKLDRYFNRITSCRVSVEAPHRHQKWGELFHIRVELGVPRGEIVVGHEPGLHHNISAHGELARNSKRVETNRPHKDIYITIADTFKAVRRRLQHRVQRLRGEVKMHRRAPSVRIEKILAS